MKRKALLSVLTILTLTSSLAQTPIALVFESEDLRITQRGLVRDLLFPPVNLESPHVHPLDLSEDDRWLAAANTFADKVELFELVDGVPQHRLSIFTGLNPVSVRFRSNHELWVTNHVSDSISILEVPSGRVKRVLMTHDEPADVVFSESANKAFVSCSQVNCLLAFDLSDLDADPEEITIQGEDPRSLAVSPDGRYVFAAVFESGNGTTVLGGGRATDDLLAYPPNVVNAPDGPYGGVNPAPNDGDKTTPSLFVQVKQQPVSLIVKKTPDGRWVDDNKGDWTAFVSGKRAAESGRVEGWDLLDHDLAILDTQTSTVSYAKGLMNICMAIDVNPADGTISMVGTEAMNHIRYEPLLKGVFVRVQQATVRVNSNGAVETIATKDLNPHLDYTVSTVPSETRELSIGDPRAIVWARHGGRAYVAGMGSNNVIVTDTKGDRLLGGRTIEVGEGPTGLALNTVEDRLYVLNRFDGSISVVDTTASKEIERVAYVDPTPEVIKAGRKHLYDTHKNSGLGHVSCGSCHVDARMDRLAWDLGDATQRAQPLERAVDRFKNTGLALTNKKVRYSNVKGPMVTQTLQGIIGNGPFHWRGDKDDVDDFNVFFETLLAADHGLSQVEMEEFKDYLNTISFPPNPFRTSDHSMPEKVALPNQFAVVNGERVALPDGDPAKGGERFKSLRLAHFRGRRCSTCHEGSASGGGYQTVNAVSELASLTQAEFKPSQLRNLHEKVGFDAGSTASLSGFGYLHDGTIDTLTRYLTQPQFDDVASLQDVADTIAFLYSKNGANVPAPASAATGILEARAGRTVLNLAGVDRDFRDVLLGQSEAMAKAIHAGVGTQLTITPETDPVAVEAFLSNVEKSNETLRAVLHSEAGGTQRTWVYKPEEQAFVEDRREQATIATLINRDEFQHGTITMVHPHMVPHLIGDTDGDGLYDYEETADLDPSEAGVQNPFDPYDPDHVGFRAKRIDHVADGIGDFDGDGISNRQEFIDGTSPIKADGPIVFKSFPIKAIPRRRGIYLRWEGLPGLYYMVERSRDLKNWETVSGPFSGGSQPTIGSSGDTNVFYRVRQLP